MPMTAEHLEHIKAMTSIQQRLLLSTLKAHNHAPLISDLEDRLTAVEKVNDCDSLKELHKTVRSNLDSIKKISEVSHLELGAVSFITAVVGLYDDYFNYLRANANVEQAVDWYSNAVHTLLNNSNVVFDGGEQLTLLEVSGIKILANKLHSMYWNELLNYHLYEMNYQALQNFIKVLNEVTGNIGVASNA